MARCARRSPLGDASTSLGYTWGRDAPVRSPSGRQCGFRSCWSGTAGAADGESTRTGAPSGLALLNARNASSADDSSPMVVYSPVEAPPSDDHTRAVGASERASFGDLERLPPGLEFELVWSRSRSPSGRPRWERASGPRSRTAGILLEPTSRGRLHRAGSAASSARAAGISLRRGSAIGTDEAHAAREPRQGGVVAETIWPDRIVPRSALYPRSGARTFQVSAHRLASRHRFRLVGSPPLLPRRLGASRAYRALDPSARVRREG